MGLNVAEFRGVRNRYEMFGTEGAIELADDNARRHGINSFPKPVIVTVHINRQNPDVSAEAGLTEFFVDRLPCEEGCASVDGIAPADLRLLVDELAVRVTTVEDHTRPVVVLQKEARIGLSVAFDAKLHKGRPLNRAVAD